jgi:hypothetical protein
MTWLPMPSWPQYEVSECGRFMRLKQDIQETPHA